METLEILGKLFDGTNRIKVMRLFLLNPEAQLATSEISKRSKVSAGTLRRELKLLYDAQFVVKDKKNLWSLNSNFPFMQPLKNLLIGGQAFTKDEIARRFKNAGRLKLLIISGIFIQDEASRADLLIVADHPKKTAIDRIVRNLEAEIGKELRYGVLDTEEFKYRVGVYDKFIRDVLDYAHERVIDKIGF